MAKASIATGQGQQCTVAGRLTFQPGNVGLDITSENAHALMADAYVWRSHVRSMLQLVEAVAERAADERDIAFAIADTIGGMRVLDEMAEAALQRACDVLNVDYDGTDPAGHA